MKSISAGAVLAVAAAAALFAPAAALASFDSTITPVDSSLSGSPNSAGTYAAPSNSGAMNTTVNLGSTFAAPSAPSDGSGSAVPSFNSTITPVNTTLSGSPSAASAGSNAPTAGSNGLVESSNYVLLQPLPGVSLTGGSCDKGIGTNCETNLGTYFSGLIKLAIAAAGVLAVIRITMGGFEYIMSASVGGKSNAKDTIQNAFIGLALALASYLILYTINPQLTKIDFSLKQPNSTTNSSN